jgi:N-6 DNA Methylase
LPVHETESLDAIRSRARLYEEALPPQQRKQLGQYFSGIPLGKLLAHLALDSETRSVLDPMAGHGDLLDATWESATERGIVLDRLDGIEIDERTAVMCRSRLAEITGGSNLPQQVMAADAFDPASIETLPLRSYDLVITNPPYVRYQARNTAGTRTDAIRSGLLSIIERRLSPVASQIWKGLAKGYSGLADLSVPAWLLAAAMVRPGGRLALVVPATWRSRDYADVIRYLLLRCFSLECIVEDKQPGWFSDALVRTHLIVARRLPDEHVISHVAAREAFPKPLWLQVAPGAAAIGSLVGTAFRGLHPEARFAAWVLSKDRNCIPAITTHAFSLHGEWTALRARITQRRWYSILEHHVDDLPLFITGKPSVHVAVPDVIEDILPDGFSPAALATLDEVGILVGQGLRTGCNSFFYVTAQGKACGGAVCVQASSLFHGRAFSVPANALRPVLRRQSDLASMERRHQPDGRVLDLREWVLPEDFDAVRMAEKAYISSGQRLPNIMPDALATYVRAAAAIPATDEAEKRIPELSAVRTNVRLARNGHVTPRFWYMLPDFSPRHQPAAFVARINHGLPWVEVNFDPPLIIDANFSTFWVPNGGWSPFALKALLNSTWCRLFMEALGASLGGGALKLEATHLRRMPVPLLSNAAKDELTRLGKQLTKATPEPQSCVDAIVLDALFTRTPSQTLLDQVAKALAGRACEMSSLRQRTAI